MATLEYPDQSFDGIAAFYSLLHLPSQEQPLMLDRIAGWLRPGGVFVASFPTGGEGDWAGEWLGVPMFFGSLDSATYRRLVAEAGLHLVLDEVVSIREPEGDATFLWIMAEKPGAL
jgi:hypothetical protein